MADPTFDDLIPTQWTDAPRYDEPTFDDLIPPQPAGALGYGEPTFDDLIPPQPAGALGPGFMSLTPQTPGRWAALESAMGLNLNVRRDLSLTNIDAAGSAPGSNASAATSSAADAGSGSNAAPPPIDSSLEGSPSYPGAQIGSSGNNHEASGNSKANSASPREPAPPKNWSNAARVDLDLQNIFDPNENGAVHVDNSNPKISVAFSSDALGNSYIYFADKSANHNMISRINLKDFEDVAFGGDTPAGVPDGIHISVPVFTHGTDSPLAGLQRFLTNSVNGVYTIDAFTYQHNVGTLTVTTSGNMYFQPGITTASDNGPDSGAGYSFSGNADKDQKGQANQINSGKAGADIDAEGRTTGVHYTLNGSPSAGTSTGVYIGNIYDTGLGSFINNTASKALHNTINTPGSGGSAVGVR